MLVQGSGSHATAHPYIPSADGPATALLPKTTTVAAAATAGDAGSKLLQGQPAPTRMSARRMHGSVSSVGSAGGVATAAAAASMFTGGLGAAAEAGAGAGSGGPSDVFTADAAVGRGSSGSTGTGGGGRGGEGGLWGDAWQALLGGSTGAAAAAAGGIFDASQYSSGPPPGLPGLSLPLHGLTLPAQLGPSCGGLGFSLASAGLPALLGTAGASLPFPVHGMPCITPPFTAAGIPSISSLLPPASHALTSCTQPPPPPHTAVKKAAAAPPVSAMFAAAAASHANAMRTHSSLLDGRGGGPGNAAALAGPQPHGTPAPGSQTGSGPHPVGPSTSSSRSSIEGRGAAGVPAPVLHPAASTTSSATALHTNGAATGTQQQQQQQQQHDALAHTLRLILDSCPPSSAAPLLSSIPPLTHHQPSQLPPSLLALSGLLPSTLTAQAAPPLSLAPACSAFPPPPLSLASMSTSFLPPPLSLASTSSVCPPAARELTAAPGPNEVRVLRTGNVCMCASACARLCMCVHARACA